jgi:hypothetical protein
MLIETVCLHTSAFGGFGRRYTVRDTRKESEAIRIAGPSPSRSFARYSQDQSFSVLGRNRGLVLARALGSIVGSFIGGLLLGVVPSAILLPALAAILIVSAFNVWRHAR